MSIRVLLVDDQPSFIQGLRLLLEPTPDIEIVDAAGDGDEAVAKARRLTPDLILMDASMPVMNGMEATRRILAEQPQAKILCLSMHSEPGYVRAMLDAGATGYVVKEQAAEELLPAIRQVMRGETFLCTAVRDHLSGVA